MTAWESLLDRFENDLGGDASSDWQVPSTPLPVELADRARQLLRHQHDRMAQLRAELATVSEHLDAVRRIPEPASDVPAFLDVNG